MVRQIKHFFQSSGLISSLIFTIVCGTLMILFDAFTTKSLHVCLPFSFKLIDLVLRDREDSVKKKVFTGRLCRTLFSVFSQFDLGWVSQIYGSSLSFLSHVVGFTRLLPHALPILFLLYTFDVIEARIWRFLPLQPPLPPPPWKGGGCVGL